MSCVLGSSCVSQTSHYVYDFFFYISTAITTEIWLPHQQFPSILHFCDKCDMQQFAFLRFYKEIKWFCAKHLRLRGLIVSLSMIKYMWNEHISILLLLCYLNGKALCQSIQMGKHSGNTNRKQSIHMGNSWHKWESTQSFNINGKALIQSIQMGKHSVSQYKWESTQSHISLVNK